MHKEDRPQKNLSSFAAAIEFASEQKRNADNSLLQECKIYWENDGHLPMVLLKKFAWSGKGKEWLENHHPFFPTFEAMTQIEAAYEMLVQARASLVELYGHYHAALVYDGFELTETVAWKTTHEVFKYVFAASALVQAYRRFLKFDVPEEDGYQRVFQVAFHDTKLAAFVQKLRNCYGHQMLIRVHPVGTISHGEQIEVKSALTFDKDLLISLPNAWNSEAKRFLERSEELNVLEIISQYHRMASALFHSYGSATGASHSKGFREVVRCKQAIRSAGHVMSLGIVLQGAKQRGTDPYAHLTKHFTKEELGRVFCFPSHSREQVDFMIKLRDPLGFCDERLRDRLYDVFDC